MIIRHYYRLLVLLVLVSLVGCTGLPFSLGDGTASGPITATEPNVPTTPNPPLTPRVTEATAETTPPMAGQYLRIWLPAEFDPERNGAANRVLKTRLSEFEAENPGMQLEVRVKALDGPGGMLDALVATSAAAPEALPDLALLPRPLLESAALKGLLYPYDGLTQIMDNEAWFEYALQMAHLKSSTYGIPFAGDVMVLVHSLSAQKSTPLSFTGVITPGNVILYPAAEPQSLFTLCMYLADGGKLQDKQGRPTLEETPLLNILEYDQQASLAEVMPYTLTQYTDDAQVWELLLAGQAPMAVTWTSTYLRDTRVEQANLGLAALPTPDGAPFTLATGWSWALSGQDSARRLMAVRLAEFLANKDFLAEWTIASGYVPPRVDALQEWPLSPARQAIEQVSYSAWLVPPDDLISTIGPALQTAVVGVLTGQTDAQSAAQAAIKQINQP